MRVQPAQHTIKQSNPIQLNQHNLGYHNLPHLNSQRPHMGPSCAATQSK